MSLQAKLISITTLLLAIVSISLGSLGYNQLKNTRNSALEDEVNAQASAFKKYLSIWSVDRKQTMSALAEQLEEELAKGSLNHNAALKLLNQAKTSGSFALTFVGLEDGTMYRHDPTLDKAGYDPRVRDWYKSAKAAQQPLITAPYIAATGKKLAITFVQPLFKNGNYIGAIGGLYYMEEIVNQVLDLKVQGNGYAVLIDKHNLITAHPNQDLILKEPTELSANLTLSKIQEIAAKNQLIDATINGKETLIFVNDVPDTDWLLALIMNKSVINAPLASLLTKTSIAVAIIIIVAAIALASLISWLFKDLRAVSVALKNIASGNGDLTLRIDVKSNDEIGLLAKNFNAFVEFLHGMLSRIKEVGDNLVDQATDTLEASGQAANEVKRQQSEVTLVATAVREMTEATQEIANNASNTAAGSDNAVSLSTNGQVQVKKSQESIQRLSAEMQQTMSTISELNKHAQEISSILSTISDIAEQTNLLALNAAIEAARAGEQGRGFAVVADEVRSLSQRTHSSTEEIRNMIDVLQKSTLNAVGSMENIRSTAEQAVTDTDSASHSFEDIRNAIETINAMATQIATAAEQQTQVTQEINNNTINIHNASETLARSSGQSASRAEQLTLLSERLRHDICLFKLN